ncbi:MAG: 2OG-Fe(II) oxygenase [Candidatus Korobacteraceae bacterium]|jgi:Rps23 Pro-64 3,4-dihydroxylase Tpa1-like proline 4-hydroxylase
MSSFKQQVVADRKHYAHLIATELGSAEERLENEFRQPGRIQSCFIDDLLPDSIAHQIFEAFPDQSGMMEKKSLREHKFVAAQMNRYDPVLEEIVFAFQDPGVVKVVEQITGLKGVVPDEHLYAGGISSMGCGHFLNPHLDNSHDKDRSLYRVLNLLYYIAPNWSHESGGNLELWDSGPQGEPREIVSKFNRLVLMATHKKSWHSVTRVKTTGAVRCCISNYYFAPAALEEHEYFHVTTFRGRPEQPVRNLILRCDAALRMAIRKVFAKGIKKPKHIYVKEGKS